MWQTFLPECLVDACISVQILIKVQEDTESCVQIAFLMTTPAESTSCSLSDNIRYHQYLTGQRAGTLSSCFSQNSLICDKARHLLQCLNDHLVFSVRHVIMFVLYPCGLSDFYIHSWEWFVLMDIIFSIYRNVFFQSLTYNFENVFFIVNA